MRNQSIVLLSLLLAGCAAPPPAVSPKCPEQSRPAATNSTLDPALAPYAFLVGNWDPAGTAYGTGKTIFEVAAGGHAIIRHNEASSPKGYHEDVMMIVAESNAIRGLYSDNEGHVLHYEAVATDTPKTAVFSTADAPGKPRFRLTYKEVEHGVSGTFEIAMPGQTDFKQYLDWVMTKR